MMRIVQITAAEIKDRDGEPSGTVYALADDGSVWMLINPWLPDSQWRKLPDLKGPKK
jgi:hypothetical protein